MTRVYLSPPDVGPRERELLLAAFDSGWIAPLGEHVDALEREVAAWGGRAHGAALSSGTAALHLALLLVGVQPGDDVLVSDLTFAASVNAITYVGAHPVLVDSEPSSWQVDPELLDAALTDRRRQGRRVGAVLAVDVYGQCADYDRIEELCARHEVPLVEDAAESLGSTYRDRPAGSFGRVGVFSFNGNKIITTSGGGMLVADDEALVARARYLATQARQPEAHYEHTDIGFNYRMSNLLAALGRGQLEGLAGKVATRRALNARYREAFADLPGVVVAPEAAGRVNNCWLTCITIDPRVARTDREGVRRALGDVGIEARPLWKPMHLQPV
ncbi:MAG: DegT/DnrJ/EryC1/StrS aminotransferase, partial [Frankiales bacterium]|nr:DegT/DnrJ/EryC1/StrS aminotransferase [Frankiales bacterium]